MVIFWGHLIAAKQDWWLDKLCIHQTREKLKKEGITALPKSWLHLRSLSVIHGGVI